LNYKDFLSAETHYYGLGDYYTYTKKWKSDVIVSTRLKLQHTSLICHCKDNWKKHITIPLLKLSYIQKHSSTKKGQDWTVQN